MPVAPRGLLATAALVAGLLATLVGVLVGAAPVEAQVQERRLGVRFEEGVPLVDVSVADFASDPEVRHKLESGLPQTLLFRAYAYAGGAEAPIAVAARSCRVVYDLWEERYRVQLTSERSSETLTVARYEDVVERCLVAHRVPIGTRAAWSSSSGQRAYVAMLVELNPLTPDTVQRIRRWLARPQRGHVDSDSFFGSFVSLFVNRRIGDAERALRFRSQEFAVP